MLLRLELLAGQAIANTRMLGADHAHVLLAEQGLLIEAGLQLGQKTDGQVGPPRFQQSRRLVGKRQHLDVDVRRQRPQAGPQTGQQHELADVGHADAEVAGGLLRIELHALAEHPLEGLQRLAYRVDQRFTQRRRVHAGGRAHKQRVTELFAQLAQRNAHRRLAKPQRLGRAAHAARFIDFVEDTEQAGIEGVHGFSLFDYRIY